MVINKNNAQNQEKDNNSMKWEDYATVLRYLRSAENKEQAWVADKCRVLFNRKYHRGNFCAMQGDDLCQSLRLEKGLMYKRVLGPGPYTFIPRG